VSWEAAVDFGTTATCSAWRSGGEATLVSHGDQGTRLPSGVVALDDRLLAGVLADRQAAAEPGRYEATPKRSLSRGLAVLALGRPVRIVDAVGEVLTQALGPVLQRQGGPPDRLVLTHPAAWGAHQLGVLGEAARAAGLPAPELVPEPVAAAVAVVDGARRREGAHVAVFDWGGGTFDAAVVRWRNGGFELAGPTSGVDPLGGEDVDDRLLDFVLERLPAADAERLRRPVTLADRRDLRQLRRDVRAAKEQLSEVTSFPVGLGDHTVTVTRHELEAVAAELVDRCVDVLWTCVAGCGLGAGDLVGVYLVGDSSRMPLVHARVWARLEREARGAPAPEPVLAWDAKGAVALGALRASDIDTSGEVLPDSVSDDVTRSSGVPPSPRGPVSVPVSQSGASDDEAPDTTGSETTGPDDAGSAGEATHDRTPQTQGRLDGAWYRPGLALSVAGLAETLRQLGLATPPPLCRLRYTVAATPGPDVPSFVLQATWQPARALGPLLSPGMTDAQRTGGTGFGGAVERLEGIRADGREVAIVHTTDGHDVRLEVERRRGTETVLRRNTAQVPGRPEPSELGCWVAAWIPADTKVVAELSAAWADPAPGAPAPLAVVRFWHVRQLDPGPLPSLVHVLAVLGETWRGAWQVEHTGAVSLDGLFDGEGLSLLDEHSVRFVACGRVSGRTLAVSLQRRLPAGGRRRGRAPVWELCAPLAAQVGIRGG
jgi:hypothetical protein